MRRTGRVMCYVSCVMVMMAATTTSAEQAKVLEELARSLSICSKLSERMNGYDVVFRRDPMRPLINKEGDVVSSSALGGGLSVQGIIWSDEHPLVVVDNELFGVGAEVGPYLIAQIQQAGVVVIRGNREFFIPLDRGLEPPPVPEGQQPESAAP